MDVHRAARICGTGHGGQVLLSDTTRGLVEDPQQGVSFRDLGKHRLKDLALPQRLFQVIVPDLPSDFPPPLSLDALPNNLPIQLTSFVGREQEIGEVKSLLTTTRLLTLMGTGGCGKTRLALQVATEVLEEFPDGVWVVELASLSDPVLVPQAVASTLDVREQPGRPLPETLVNYLRPLSLLLLVDNCEHLLPTCAEVANVLLRSCPRLHILTTSRESLGIAGETRWQVPPLSLPEAHHLPSAEELVRYEAVRLFVERASAALPTFKLTDQNAPVVARICHRLDGIPLAIELAAARTRVLTVEQIAIRLDDRFRLLANGSRITLPRHQRLRAAFDWSYDLLSGAEQILLRRLSGFAGGFTLNATEAVCASDEIAEQEMLDLLTHLVDKSLVIVEERDDEARYRLLETVRQYAWEKSQESGEAHIRARHLTFFLSLAEAAAPGLVGERQAAWLNRLERDHDNLRAALEWSADQPEVGLRLAAALAQFWEVHGYWTEGRERLASMLDRTKASGPSAVRAKALTAVGRLAWYQGDYAAARTRHEESLAINRELGVKQGIAQSLSNLGLVALDQGDYTAARVLYEQSLAINGELGDKQGIGRALGNLGIVACRLGDYASARSLHEQTLMMFRELGGKRDIAYTLNNLAEVAFHQGEHVWAGTLFRQSIAMKQELGDRYGIAYTLERMAALSNREKRPERAAKLLGAAQGLRESIGALIPPALREEYEREVATVHEALGEHAKAAWAEGRGMTLEQAIECALATGGSHG
jgi:predicted ATPase